MVGPTQHGGVPRGTPPPAAAAVFAERLPVAEAYAGLLGTVGIERGLLGPREVDRLWDRHLLNCAVVADLLPVGATVVDVGSGAGLPGLVLGIRRPDLRVTLLEPLLRRTAFLEEAVGGLGLENVEVLRGRAEELHRRRTFDVVTSRAVAPLERLLRWCLPLVAPDGSVVAMKGASAGDEVAALGERARALGASRVEVVRVGSEETATTTVVRAGVDPAGRLRWGSPGTGATTRPGGRSRRRR